MNEFTLLTAQIQELMDGAVGIIMLVFIILVAAMWVFLPFAVYGIKKHLNSQLEVSKMQLEVSLEIMKFMRGDAGKPRDKAAVANTQPTTWRKTDKSKRKEPYFG